MFSVYDMAILMGCLCMLVVYIGLIWFEIGDDK